MPRGEQVPYRQRISTRNNGVALFNPGHPKIHNLQSLSNARSQAISRQWLTNPVGGAPQVRVAPPSRRVEPRLIGLVINRRSYYNSTYQALMHVPIFIQWIRSHPVHHLHGGPPCIACGMRSLVNEYWSAALAPGNSSIPDQRHFLRTLRHRAAGSLGGLWYGTVSPGDIYRWFVTEVDDWANPVWHHSWEALFALRCQLFETCQTCHVRREVSGPLGVESVGIDLPRQIPRAKSINEGITTWFAETVVRSPCISPQCQNMLRSKKQHRKIFAAPSVLIITIKTFLHNGDKVVLNPRVDYNLDLTQLQKYDSVSLRYTLSSTIGHSGPDLATGETTTCLRSHNDCNQPYWFVSSNVNQSLANKRQFLRNPQPAVPPAVNDYQVIALTYIKDENSSVANINRSRELRRLR